MILTRRFLSLAALMFWQGGFVFYSASVVPVGMRVLDSPALQSFITLEVTRYLNLAGAVALPVMALELAWTHDRSRKRRAARWLCWTLMLAALAGLFLLHPKLVHFMDPEHRVILDRDALWPWHRAYLLLSTGQWLCAMIFLGLSVRTWWEEDWRKGKEVSAQKSSAVDGLGVAQSPIPPLGGTI